MFWFIAHSQQHSGNITWNGEGGGILEDFLLNASWFKDK